MASKNISIRLDLYKKLKELKDKDESFSDIIEKLLDEGMKGTPSRMMKHFGAWKELPEDFDDIVESFRETVNKETESRLKERLDDISG
ncbi:MAG: antitoxin [Candidatus Lokiarchaeota archaeon]|nr:antitoxin [Candidatus Lokiarchaeota archaeon]MBD3200485.1 antitoxin [Candidatus Lokiarchaeota archaeon]